MSCEVDEDGHELEDKVLGASRLELLLGMSEGQIGGKGGKRKGGRKEEEREKEEGGGRIDPTGKISMGTFSYIFISTCANWQVGCA